MSTNAYDPDETPVETFGGHPDMTHSYDSVPSSDEVVQDTVVVDGVVQQGTSSYDDAGNLRVRVDAQDEVPEGN